jgi:NAD(P)-dependent dehydrogenase (short-subunit alcohol dehydrogenase family)
MRFEKRNVVVTGGSQGLGRAIVERFMHEGANVLFCARDSALLGQLETEWRKSARSGQVVIAQACDVSSVNDIENLFRRVDVDLGPLHVLVNNAGIYGPKGPSEEVDWDEWIQCLEINLYGTFLPCRQAIKRFKKLGYGKIINLSGGGATTPLPNISGYAASKAAVVRLTETLAEELRAFRVDVNALAPGALNTRFLDEVLQAGPEKVGAGFYARALKQSEEGGVPLEMGADLCLYLASAESDGITGKLLHAKWDPWASLQAHRDELHTSDIYTLRRIVPEDRGKKW